MQIQTTIVAKVKNSSNIKNCNHKNNTINCPVFKWCASLPYVVTSSIVFLYTSNSYNTKKMIFFFVVFLFYLFLFSGAKWAPIKRFNDQRSIIPESTPTIMLIHTCCEFEVLNCKNIVNKSFLVGQMIYIIHCAMCWTNIGLIQSMWKKYHGI